VGVGGRAAWRPGRSRAAEATRAEIADLLELLVAPLRAGVAPSVALGAALDASSPVGPRLAELVRDLGEASASAADVGVVWLAHAAVGRSADLELVGRAWLLTERTGAPLADALEVAEGVLRGRIRARARLDSAAAGPRASMVVLVLLPCSAPLVGLVFGLSPAELYLSSPAATFSGLLGLLLVVLGWWWSHRILARALDVHPAPRQRAVRRARSVEGRSWPRGGA
jgi:tight adherence protein B